MMDAIDGYLGLPTSGLPGMLAPTGSHHDPSHGLLATSGARGRRSAAPGVVGRRVVGSGGSGGSASTGDRDRGRTAVRHVVGFVGRRHERTASGGAASAGATAGSAQSSAHSGRLGGTVSRFFGASGSLAAHGPRLPLSGAAAAHRPTRRAIRVGRSDMFVLVVGGGKVGYYLAKELIESGHEIALMEKDSVRARQIADEIGSIVIAHDGCEGKYLGEAGCNRADVVAAVTGDDEDNLVICQMAKHHFDVPRTIARVNNPKNEALFRHLGVDELISPTRMILGSIEQDIPVHELLHLAALGEGELELIEAHLQAGSPAIGRAPKDLQIPEGCSLFAVIRDGIATPLRQDTVMLEGDKIIAIGKQECQDLLHDQLIGDPEAAEAG